MRALVVAALIVGSGSVHAADAPLHYRTVPASKKVQAFAQGLAKALRLPAAAPTSRRYPKQELDQVKPGQKPFHFQAKEIDLKLRGLRVRRLFCRTAAQAIRWAARTRATIGLRGRSGTTPQTRRVVSVRGRHVLVLDGARLTDATFLRLAFHHGWTLLPARAKTLDLIAVDAAEASVTRSWKSPLLERWARRSLARIRGLRSQTRGKTRTMITWHGAASVQVDLLNEDRQSDVFVDARAGVRIATGPTDELRQADRLLRTLYLDHTRRLHPARQPHPLTPEPPAAEEDTVSARAHLGGNK